MLSSLKSHLILRFVHTYLWNAQTQLLILYWLVLIVAFIAIVTYLLFSEKPKWKLTWIRKLFHLLALLLFLPGIHYQVHFATAHSVSSAHALG